MTKKDNNHKLWGNRLKRLFKGDSTTQLTTSISTASPIHDNLGRQRSESPLPLPRQSSPVPSANHEAQEAAKEKKKQQAIGTEPEALWDRAYNDLKEENPKLLEAYESALAKELTSEQETNALITDHDSRKSQMDHLLDAGLAKTAKINRVEGKIGKAIDIVLSVKAAMDLGLKTVPIAATAWVGICVALGLVMNPITEAQTNRDGIVDVTVKMKWYSSLSKILHHESLKSKDILYELREQLAERMLNLYKVILEYMIKTVCSHHRHQGVVAARALVKWDGWQGSLDSVAKAESSLEKAIAGVGLQQTNSYLEVLVHMQQSKEDEEMMRRCYVTDMKDEIKSLQDRKDILIPECYRWIFEDKKFQKFIDWKDGNTDRLLWVKGHPGKGKTMLLIGVVEELTASMQTRFDECCLSYFFCRATDNKLNNAASVLRGLIWMLLQQEKSLVRHLISFREKGADAFNEASAFYSLRSAFVDMLQDKALTRVYLVVDALDECRSEKGQPSLQHILDLITETAKNDKVKWLVSSRNEEAIEKSLGKSNSQLSLELNQATISQAVNTYIDQKVSELTGKHIQEKTTNTNRREEARKSMISQNLDQVKKVLKQKANGTFLWVSLVMQELNGCDADKIVAQVQKMPSDLYDLYTAILEKVKPRDYAAQCRNILQIMAAAYRPLRWSELEVLAELPIEADTVQTIRRCGLLALGNADDIVYFVHQSAKDYLVQNKDPWLSGNGHEVIVTASLKWMKESLKRDIYNKKHPGFCIDEWEVPNEDDPLESLRYSCIYWADHLSHTSPDFQAANICDDSPVHQFWRKSLLYWLEALSFLRSYTVAVNSAVGLIRLLSKLAPEAGTEFDRLVQDSRRFILKARTVVEHYPLQVYASALIFAPSESLTRKNFKNEEPQWLETKPSVAPEWDRLVFSLDHRIEVYSIFCASDGSLLASIASDSIKIWDLQTGQFLREFQSGQVTHYLVFSPDKTKIAYRIENSVVEVKDINTGQCLSKHYFGDSGFTINDKKVCSLAFSPAGHLAAVVGRRTIKIWDTDTGECLKTISPFHEKDHELDFAFISDELIAVVTRYEEQGVIWDVKNEKPLESFTIIGTRRYRQVAAHSNGLVVVADHDGDIMAWKNGHTWLKSRKNGDTVVDEMGKIEISSSGSTIFVCGRRILIMRDAENGNLIKMMRFPTNQFLKYSGNNLVIGTEEADIGIINVWDLTGTNSDTDNDDFFGGFAFCQGRIAAIMNMHGYNAILVRDTKTGLLIHNSEHWWKRRIGPDIPSFSLNGKLQLISGDGMIRIWDQNGTLSEERDDFIRDRSAAAFSDDGTALVLGGNDGAIRVGSLKNPESTRLVVSHGERVEHVALSSCNTVASASYCHDGGTITIRDVDSGDIICEMHIDRRIRKIQFSLDGTRLLAKDWKEWTIWDTSRGELLRTFSKDSSMEKPYEFLNPGASSPYTIKSSDFEWILYKGERVLWLSPEHRPYMFEWWANGGHSDPNVLAIQNISRGTSIFRFSASGPPLS